MALAGVQGINPWTRTFSITLKLEKARFQQVTRECARNLSVIQSLRGCPFDKWFGNRPFFRLSRRKSSVVWPVELRLLTVTIRTFLLLSIASYQENATPISSLKILKDPLLPIDLVYLVSKTYFPHKSFGEYRRAAEDLQ